MNDPIPYERAIALLGRYALDGYRRHPPRTTCCVILPELICWSFPHPRIVHFDDASATLKQMEWNYNGGRYGCMAEA